jgi:hypothetical protein
MSEMKTSGARERPILFSAPMVRAILDGRKTQTRRAIKPQPGPDIDPERFRACRPMTRRKYRYMGNPDLVPPCEISIRPFAFVGQRIWVKEHHRLACWNDRGEVVIEYADGTRSEWTDAGDDGETWVENATLRLPDGYEEDPSLIPWRSPATMPRWASRITLEVTDVRVERLQDITEADAVAEGLLAREGDGAGPGPGYKWRGTGYHGAGFTKSGEPTFHTPGVNGRCSCAVGGPTPAQCAYREYWDARHGRGSWAANPWVWALTFRRINHA